MRNHCHTRNVVWSKIPQHVLGLMSYVDIFSDYETNKIARGMLADASIITFLDEHPQITSIRFCLDGDAPGRKAAIQLMEKYYEMGYEVEDCPPPEGYKDYNEWLVENKKEVCQKSSTLFRKVCQKVTHFFKRCVKKWHTFPKGMSKSDTLL